MLSSGSGKWINFDSMWADREHHWMRFFHYFSQIEKLRSFFNSVKLGRSTKQLEEVRVFTQDPGF
jgi:hypothetical protein